MTTRRRGRPSGGGGAGREAIVAAARTQFAAKGFAATSLRSIATAAGVNPTLIGHYFEDKAALLVATLDLPVDPVERVHEVLAGGPDGLGARMVRTFLTTWDPHAESFSALYRTQVAGEQVGPGVDLARTILVEGLAQVLTGDDVALRAELIATHVLGLAAARYVVGLPAVAQATVDDLVAHLGPVLQGLVDGRRHA